MPLQKRTVPLVMDKGIDAGRDPKTSSGPLKLQNTHVDIQGVMSRRFDVEAISNSTTSNESIAKLGDSLLSIGKTLEVYDTVPSASFTEIGEMELWYPSGETVKTAKKSEMRNLAGGKFTTSGGDEVYLYTYNDSSGNLYVQTVSVDTGKIIDTETVNSGITDEGASVVEHDSKLFVFFANTANALSYVMTETDGTLTSPAAVSGATAVYNNNGFVDSSVFNDSDKVLVTYLSASTNLIYGVFDYNGGSPTWSEGAYISANIKGKFCCFEASSQDCCVAFSETAVGVMVRKIDSSLATQWTTITSIASDAANEFALSGIGEGDSNDKITVLACKTDSTLYYDAPKITYSELAPLTGNEDISDQHFASNVYLHSKPFYKNISDDRFYVPVMFSGTTNPDEGDSAQATIFILNDHREPVAKWLVGTATYLEFVKSSRLRSDTSDYLLVARKIVSKDTETWCGVHFATFAEKTQTNVTEAISSITVPSSMALEFNGRELTELGFNYYPDGLNVTANGTGGSISLSSGNHSYQSIYKWRDAAGRVHESAPSPAVSVTVDAATHDNVTISIPRYSLTMMSGVSIILYRTDANEIVYKELDESDNAPTSPPLTQYYTFTDTGSVDTSEAPQLYTDGGILGNIAPPPHEISLISGSRHYCVDAERPENRVIYSKEFVRGLAIEHSDLLRITVDSVGGAITALARLDDKVLIFKKNRIFVAYGSPANNLGVGEFADIYSASSAIGCINQRSVVEIPSGIMFESDNGIYLIDRQLKIIPIGEPARLYYNQITLSRGVHIPDYDCVVFFDSSSNDTALTYNYKFNYWMTWTGMRAEEAMVIDSTLYYMNSSVTKRRVSSSNTTQDVVIETGHLSFADTGGMQRVYRVLLVGQNLTAGDKDNPIKVSAQFDFDPVWIDGQSKDLGNDYNFDITDYIGDGLAAGYKNQAMVLDVRFSRQRCTTIRIKIEDGSGAVAAQSTEPWSLSAIVFQIGLKPQAFHPDSARKVS